MLHYGTSGVVGLVFSKCKVNDFIHKSYFFPFFLEWSLFYRFFMKKTGCALSCSQLLGNLFRCIYFLFKIYTSSRILGRNIGFLWYLSFFYHRYLPLYFKLRHIYWIFTKTTLSIATKKRLYWMICEICKRKHVQACLKHWIINLKSDFDETFHWVCRRFHKG